MVKLAYYVAKPEGSDTVKSCKGRALDQHLNALPDSKTLQAL